ncbi:MAG: type II secretion system protein GspL [Rheinheimera sp.]|nr:MAG: type II secretion system protein GspL [Rheinheimera sp.]
MSEQLIIRLGSVPQQPVWWLIWSAASAEVIASGQLADASELTGLAERIGVERPLTALLPACDVVLKEVALPGKPNRQMLQALPYMLEEEQAEDIEQLLVLSAQTIQRDSQYLQQVAVLRRSLLEQWLDLLQQAGFAPRRLLPDALLLPLMEQPVAVQLGSQWLLRHGDWQGSCIDDSWWPDYLQLAALPEILSYSPWPDSCAGQLHQLAPAELPLALLAQQLDTVPFNLLQGAYAPKKVSNKHWVQWRLSGSLAAACAVLYLCLVGAEAWKFSREAATARSEASALYKQQFPQERIVNLKRQVERKLTASSTQGQHNLLALLDGMTPALGGAEPVVLNNLKFDSKKSELKLLATAASFQRFEALKAQLQQQGYQVDQGTLSQIDGKVQGTLTLRSKS